MSKIIDAQDILADARACIECIDMAVAAPDRAWGLREANAIKTVADMAVAKIEEADALLEEYRTSIGEGSSLSGASEEEP